MKKSDLVKIIKESLNESSKDSVAQKEFKMNYSQLGKKEKEWVDDEIDNIEYKKKKKVVKEGQEKSVDQLMSDLGDAILADNNEAMKVAFKNLKTGLIGRIKNKAEDLKGRLDKKYTNENYEEADDEFDTGGYVEAMGPELDKHIKAIAGIFQEWKNGPSTEPGMVGYATYDLIEYIKKTLRR